MAFMPISKEDMRERGIDQLDFVYILGDAYVDHPSFGAAIITRLLEHHGYTVGVIAQPNWKDPKSVLRLGLPKLAWLVSAGNIDSMVAHYTVAKRPRADDAYSAGGRNGKRPDRAATVYCNLCRNAAPEIPVLCGGLEVSLRRFAHYDYWSNTVMPSVLADTRADLLMYGMGEHSMIEIADRLAAGEDVKTIRDVRGTCYLCDPRETPYGAVQCPSFKEVSENKELYAKSCRIQYDQQDEVYGKTIIQRHGDKMLVQNPPALSLTTAELDEVYSLPYERAYHPCYEKEGGVPSIEEVRFSVTHNRGCFGFCNFCSIALHQGRRVTVRSEESVLEEARKLTEMEGFKGYIHDVGGPTANFRGPSCEKQLKYGLCKGKKCLAPSPCKNLHVDHTEYLHILREMRKIPKIKKVFIRSGIRYDYLIEDKDEAFMRELIEYHISGQLKVAPEHCSAAVLDKMGKPHIEAYKRFQKKFYEITGQKGKEQYLVPYLMSSHPGSALKDAVELAMFLKENHIHPEQVQDFYPTPGTLSTCMFYTGFDPYTLEPVYVAKKPEEKAMQRVLLQYYKPENQRRVIEALCKAGREDLIGNGAGKLVRPDSVYLKMQREKQAKRGERNARGRNANGRNPAAKTPQRVKPNGRKKR
ncbi:YgiQ family radical SAM protein [Ruminococcus sp. 210702-SL.1.03]|uniref:YgiQ family radical SAM protein n=1 Tax=Ruminococcus sp. 210702-SL.1.03 TaxID=2883233 RepID=UPI001D094456|nr:YgiQ family radical SAM protein [Ruminococcus sp. 210702-SL.1.03]MCB6615512.1 YgiQ family radical SAM protein [Ruminococcus sp. 210702-SL.1.03]